MPELIYRFKSNCIGLEFPNYDDYYETLGFLSHPRTTVRIYTHKNQQSGAYGSQGKLECTNNILTRPLLNSFQQSKDNRLSVSSYVNTLIRMHHFQLDDPTNQAYTVHVSAPNVTTVRSTVPNNYLPSFDRGYNMLEYIQ